MKTKLLLLLILLSGVIIASPVDSTFTKKVAKNFFNRHSGFNKEINKIKLHKIEKNTQGNIELYYIYNINDNDGWVIVSADNAASPILGYSLKGHFDATNMPPALSNFLNNYKQQILSIKNNNVPATSGITNKWQKFSSSQTQTIQTQTIQTQTIQIPSIQNQTTQTQSVSIIVNPLISTTWNQGNTTTGGYYNNLCPSDANLPDIQNLSQHCPVGCVVTAMSQIMKYWNYPSHGVGQNSYTPPNYPNTPLNVNFANDIYNWNDMPVSLSASSTQNQINAVALLMYDCGVSTNMNYGPDNSGADVLTWEGLLTYHPHSAENAYKNYFGYNSSTIQGKLRSNYTEQSWIALIENELNNSRPVQYVGNNNIDGHTWVCDGYDSQDFFHMNWGWGGYADFNSSNPTDGFYNLSVLNTSNGNFSTNQEALIGIIPATTITTIQTLNATNITSNSATLNCNVYPNGHLTDVQFFYGINPYDSSVNSGNIPAFKFYPINMNVTINYLLPSTTYHFKAKAMSVEEGNIYSNDITFTTLPDTTFYSINFSSYPTYGGNITYNNAAYYWENAIIKASPNAGYKFKSWKENGIQVSTDSIYSFIVTGNKTLVAEFIIDTTNYSINFSSNPTYGGNIVFNAASHIGDTAIMHATPNTGYKFSNWNDGGIQVSTDSIYTFVVTGNRNLVAEFIIDTTTVNLSIGLVASYPFNGNANDASGNENNGTVNGATLTTDRFGNANSAYSFDGVSNYIQVNSSALNSLPLSISIWCNPSIRTDLSPCPNNVISNDNISYYGHGIGMNIWASSSEIVIEYQNGFKYTQNTYNLNTWYNITAVYETGYCKLYLNGNLINTFLYTQDIMDGLNTFTIGKHNDDINYGSRRFYSGSIDDIRVYNRALLQTEIDSLFHKGGWPLQPVNLNTGLVASYPFNGNANDASGNENNGTVNGATLTTDRFGNTNSAYSFDGNESMIYTANNINIYNNQARTVSSWFLWKINNNSTNPAIHDILGWGNTCQEKNYQFLQISSIYGIILHYHGGNNDIYNPLSLIDTTAWHHLVYTHDGITSKLFIDGILINQKNIELVTVNTSLQIGYTNNFSCATVEYNCCWNTSFKGKIDDIKIYNRAISQTEIDSLYHIGGWSLQQPIQYAVYDIDGNGYDTVNIGTQTWLKQNLNVSHYRNGDAIPNVTDYATWAALTTGASCYYNNDINNAATYGRFYNFYTVVDTRNLCPTGWHVPSDNDWTILTNYLGGEGIAGGKLKETGLTHWLSPNLNATNETDFSALGSGYYAYYNQSCIEIGYDGDWWTSTTNDENTAWFRGMYADRSYVFRWYYTKHNGFSVRCLKDIPLCDLSTITTNSISNITQNTGTSGGNISYVAGLTITSRGVCWSTNQNPTISDSKTTNGVDTGNFTSSLTALTSNTTYYVRAYAIINNYYIVYGNQQTFTTQVEGTVFNQSYVNYYEYWFDDNYTNKVSASTNSTIMYSINSNISTNGLNDGLHSFHIRFLDQNGNWSSIISQFFTMLHSSNNITKSIENYEYWFDNNYESKVSEYINSQRKFNMSTDIPTNTLSNGLHSYHIRYQDDAGQWSAIVSQFFNKTGSSLTPFNTITAYRYWFDMEESDMVNVKLSSPANPYQLIKNICISNLTVGNHTTHFQFKDTLQAWSSILSYDFYKDTPIAPTISANKSIPICQGETVTLTTSSQGSYKWNTGETTQSIDVTTSGIYSVIISNCNIDTVKTIVTVNPLVFDAGLISGLDSVNQSPNTKTYTVDTIANATSYIWTLPNGATGTSTTNSIDVIFGASAVSGNITVKGSNSCGDGAISTLAISINHLPSNAGIISGQSTVCQGQSNITYTVPTIENATSYIWTLPNGVMGTSATNSIDVTFEANAISGYITVKGTNSFGDGALANISITVNEIPTTPIVTVQNNCGNSFISTTANGNLLWSNNATSSLITVTNSATYTVTQTINGCTSLEGSGNAQPITIPDSPVISVQNNCGSSVLSTTATGTLLWSTGETTPSINVINAGTHTLTQTINGCTSPATSESSAPKTIPIISGTTPNARCSNGTITLGATPSLGTVNWYDASTIGNLLGTGTTFTTPSISTTTTYYAEAINNSCTSLRTAVIAKINALPTVTANASATTICAGASITLSGGGAATYSWDQDVINAIPFTIGNNSIYHVTGTDTNGCINTASVSITVNQRPTAIISGNQTINIGSSANLTINASGTGFFNGSLTDGTNLITFSNQISPFTVSVSPIITKTYTLSALTDSSCNAIPSSDLSGNATVIVRPIVVNVKVILQGAYNTGTGLMNTTLRAKAYFPRSQPYSGAPWNYNGTESVVTISANVVDWVLVELRTGIASSTIVNRKVGFILNDGSIVDIDGTSKLGFPGIGIGNYYIVVRHRNHLAVMSATAQPLSSTSSLYDFTTAINQSYGASNPAILKNNKSMMIMGDVNSNGTARATGPSSVNDFAILSAYTGALVKSEYSAYDVNLDGNARSTGPGSVNDGSILSLALGATVFTSKVP